MSDLEEQVQAARLRMWAREGDQWWIEKKVLPDGRVLFLFPTLTNVRLGISPNDHEPFFDEFYCYHNTASAFKAIKEWDGKGDPEDWVRHVPSNRRRPNGDPEEEYVAP